MDQLVRSEPFYPLNYGGRHAENTTTATPAEWRLCRGHLLCCNTEELRELVLIKPNDQIVSDRNNWYAHLP